MDSHNDLDHLLNTHLGSVFANSLPINQAYIFADCASTAPCTENCFSKYNLHRDWVLEAREEGRADSRFGFFPERSTEFESGYGP